MKNPIYIFFTEATVLELIQHISYSFVCFQICIKKYYMFYDNDMRSYNFYSHRLTLALWKEIREEEEMSG